MRQRVRAGAMLLVVAALMPAGSGVWAAELSTMPVPPLVFADVCATRSSTPTRVEIVDAPEGPMVKLTWPNALALETHDANLAHKSRRFFFRLRTADALIEFQGHATTRALDGVLSDERGTHHLTLPAASAALPPCEDRR